MDLKMDPLVIESIRRYRRRVTRQKLALMAPLALAISGCLAALVFLTAAAPVDRGRIFTTEGGGPAFLLWIIPVALIVLFFLLAVRRPRGEFTIVPDDEAGAAAPFRRALDGLSTAAGCPVPPLLVLRMPTVNSLAFLHAGKPSVGVSLEALEAGVPPRRAEAMMAHELSHILTGELYPASSRRRFQLLGWAMISLLLTLVVMVTLMAGLSPWIGLALLATVPFLLFWAAWRSRFIGRHNDLLADSIAVKLTYDPEGFKQTLEKMDRLFMENPRPFKPEARYPYYLFVYRVRPQLELARARKLAGTFYSQEDEEVFAEGMDKWVKRMSSFPRDTLEMRLRNLEAIELGHWPAFSTTGSGLEIEFNNGVRP